MPELPEVEVIRRGLLPLVTGQAITSIFCSSKKLRLPIPKQDLLRWIQSQEIIEINRRGKYLIFIFSNDAVMLVHLGMSGKLGIFSQSAPTALHDHLIFKLHNDMQLRFNDPRRFGLIRVFPPGQFSHLDPFKDMGCEPLEHQFSGEYLKRKAGSRLQPIKNFLMDNRMVAGIGNIYANEILFHCGLHPSTPIGSITRPIWQLVAMKTKDVLLRAIECGGSSISDFVNSSGQKGYFQLELTVYGRAGEHCPRCTATIIKQVIGGRSTFFCPNCQK